MLQVLISCPSLSPDVFYYPYIYAVLKSYFDSNSNFREEVQWLTPINKIGTPKNLLHTININNINIVGLSCYTWNWSFQCSLAQYIKEFNKNILVVAGGPHPDWKNPLFFQYHPYIDAVVVQEGEEPFRQILEYKITGIDISNIPGLVTKNKDNSRNSLRLDLSKCLVSPWEKEYKTHQDIYNDIKHSDHQGDVCAVLETTRGCPYSCTFCDWGSLTFSKIRSFPIEKVKKDIDFITEHKIDFLFIADANWGISSRDIEISKYLCKTINEKKSIKYVYFSPTKSSGKNLQKISSIFKEHRIYFSATISIQHTDDKVLNAISRKNLQKNEISDLINFYKNHDIPTYVQLILGCPGDTPKKWLSCLSNLIESGLDGNFYAFNFMILPNAPAAEKEYREKWGIVTHKTISTTSGSRQTKHSIWGGDNEYIVATSTYTKTDWIFMWKTYILINALHSFGLLRIVSKVFREIFNIPYFVFYSELIQTISSSQSGILGKINSTLHNEKLTFLSSADHPIDEILCDENSQYQGILRSDEWVFYTAALNKEKFYLEITDIIQSFIPTNTYILDDLISFQKNILVDPSYKKDDGRKFLCHYDWTDILHKKKILSPKNCLHTFYINQKHIGPYSDEPIKWRGTLDETDISIWLQQVPIGAFARADIGLFNSIYCHNTLVSTKIFGSSI